MKEKVFPCRFGYPFDKQVKEGCNVEAEDGKLKRITAKLNKEGELEIDGSIHTGDKLLLLRNH